MYFVYNIVLTFLIFISPFIFLLRVLNKKEDPKRFLEKFCIYKNKKNSSKIIWVHAASIGELLSVVPLIKKLEKVNNVKKILLTTSTVSSAKVFKKIKLKKTFHKFYPLDTNHITKKFISCWKPQLAIFVDSEIWPNMLKNLKENKIPTILINARITNKSFKRWKIFGTFANEVFSKITIALPSNLETQKYLKILGVEKIKFIGNLKFYGDKKVKNKNNIKNKFKNLKLWCAASTHEGEEELIYELHKNIKKYHKKLITILIPRHVNRIDEIISDLKMNNLNFIKHSSNQKNKKNTDIYLVDTYGETSKFYDLTNITFLGGSIIKHGGQNPLEPARQGNYILSGPNIDNFREVYAFLLLIKLSTISSDPLKLQKLIRSKISQKISNQLQKKIINIGDNILINNLKEITGFIK